MNQSANLDAWREDGERLWSRIQQSKLVVIPWNNPWRRLALLALVPLITAAVAAIMLKSRYPSLVFTLISLPLLIPALIFFVVGRRTGGLYSFFTESAFGIGCEADRISIPYSAIQLPQKVNPATVNNNYLVLPVKAETTGVLIERKNGKSSPWDGKPYRRGIASAFIKDGAFYVKAFPKEMVVRLFCAIHPLSMHLKAQASEPDAAPSSAATIDHCTTTISRESSSPK
jgi:hypothetical protein